MKRLCRNYFHVPAWSLIIVFLTSCSGIANQQNIATPVAEKIEKQLTLHGDTRTDFYYWLNDRDNPAVIDYLNAENEYLDSKMASTEKLQEQLFREMSGRIKQDESTAPYLDNGYFYYTRFEHGGEYPIYCRKKGSMEADEEIILNIPEMAMNYPYFRIGDFAVSTNNKLIAFTADTLGRRQYTIYVKNLQSQEVTSTGIQYAAGDIAWANDNQTLFFTTIDPVTLRYEKVFRYNIEQKQPVEVYNEVDDTFYYMGVSRTKDGKYITIKPRSTLSNEVLILNASDPTGTFKPFQPRQKDLLYSIEHSNDKFYILTNHLAQNFRLMETKSNQTRMENWREVIPHRKDVLLEGLEVFSDFIVLQKRKLGLRQLQVINTLNNEKHYIDFDEEAYSVSININRESDTNLFRFSYTSLTTPNTIIDYDMVNRRQNHIWQQTVLGDFNPDNYEAQRLFVTSRDGVQIPVTMVYKKGMEKNGRNPVYQYGYGSYGSSREPRFNSNLISLLDRDFIYVIAHIRGGQELGRQWYEDGKLFNKINTFNDFIDVSEYLIAEEFTSPQNLFAGGGSAGGLLMGAVVNMRPDLYKGIVAGVAFVDVVTTMLDETIPLTTSEYDEWGNPNDPEYYHYMLSYSPYDQITRQEYPNILATSGLYDSQVQYWEPTKWVAKLRDYNTADTRILLHTNMEAGHSGASGRFRRIHELALQYAFILNLSEREHL